MQIDKQTTDKAMRILCDFFEAGKPNTEIGAEYLLCHGFEESDNVGAIISALCAQKLITYESDYKNQPPAIKLTDKGKIYFIEQEKEIEREKRAEKSEIERQKRQFRHDWKIAVFSALAGAFLSEPLWTLIRQIIDLFLEKS